jgi:hypothetical protein
VFQRLVAAVALVCFGGCTTTATIARTDGPDTEARIEHSDANAIYVRARNGGIYRIPRQGISDIDHPGNVEILLGSILAGIAAIGIAELRGSQSSSDRDAALTVGFVYGAPALWLITSGLMKYVPSVQAAHDFESAEPAPPGTWNLAAPPPVTPVLPPQAPPPAPPPTAPAEPAPATTPPPPPESPTVTPGPT